MELFTFTNLLLAGGFGFLTIGFLVLTTLRRVVPTNEVHIIQSSKKTTSYGKDTGNGNTYYQWPTSLPFLGVTKTIMPTSVFDFKVDNYEAYDKGRLPFEVDVMAFFRVDDSNVAAQRVANFTQLKEQLTGIVKGAVRSVLASADIESILESRSTFGDAFTKEVEPQLKNWGVAAVKNLELMDIRDLGDNQVIHNIMAKKKSHIEMESRTEVAKNHKLAEIAEIEAKREVDIQAQQAAQAVGLRTVESKQQVALSQQSMNQLLKDQEKTTKEKEMAVTKVEQVRKAEIERDVQITKAEQDSRSAIIAAEAKKNTSVLLAEGNLELKRREAEGISLEGNARADAEKAMQLAPVQAQITLAKEIGSNDSYQKYLITIRRVEADQAVGIAQAEALTKADVKIISNTGTPTAGVSKVMDLFSSKGGTELGGMLEGLAQTSTGKELLNKFLGGESEVSTPTLTAPVSTSTNGSGKPLSNGKH